jgi:uncharacterized protein (DUF302 family)
MEYYINKTVSQPFDETLEQVVAALKEQGFGVLTEIDVKATLKKKLDVDFRRYMILGACNPPFAYQAFQADDKIGILLPCNVIVQELDDGQVEVAVMDPVSAMQMIENAELAEVAAQVRTKLEAMIDSL